MADTEWRLLAVDIYGDITSLNEYDTKAEANKALSNATPYDGAILTVEGQRHYGDGMVAFQRTGRVRGDIRSDEQRTFCRKDEHWYAAGEEPDFNSR